MLVTSKTNMHNKLGNKLGLTINPKKFHTISLKVLSSKKEQLVDESTLVKEELDIKITTANRDVFPFGHHGDCNCSKRPNPQCAHRTHEQWNNSKRGNVANEQAHEICLERVPNRIRLDTGATEKGSLEKRREHREGESKCRAKDRETRN